MQNNLAQVEVFGHLQKSAAPQQEAADPSIQAPEHTTTPVYLRTGVTNRALL